MTRGRLYDLDFGPHEKSVRWIEDTPPASFAEELDRRLAKVRAEGVDALLRAAALSSARSVRYDGSGRMPHGLLVLSSARSLAAITPPEGLRPLLAHVLRLIHQEIHHPGFGPFRLLDFDEVAGEGKEGTLFSFLEAARAGETDWADHRFAWLVRNLERDQVVDLLLSSGLEGATQDPHNVVGVVESVALLQGIGWEHAPVLLRPIVRRQASGLTGLAEYEECRETVARLDLLRLARRRPPGQPAFGERDPQAFLEQAGQWAEGDPKARSSQISSLLAEGVPLEDAADLVALGAALLLLQETLRPSEGQASEEDVDRRVHLATGPLGLRQLVRIGAPGQRILGLLLAGAVPPVDRVRLAPRSPDCGWWLSPASRLLEPSPTPETQEGPVPAAWAEQIRGGQANGLLPLITERLEAGGTAVQLEGALAAFAPYCRRAPGLAIKLERALAEAYRGSRTPHRWMHRWAAGLALALWPRESEVGSTDRDARAAKAPV